LNGLCLTQLALESVGAAPNQPAFLLRELVGMDPMIGSQLGYRLQPCSRLEGHIELEQGTEDAVLIRYEWPLHMLEI
jgi:hypothetical protein